AFTRTMFSLSALSTVTTLGMTLALEVTKCFCSLSPNNHNGFILKRPKSSITTLPDNFVLPLSISAVVFGIPKILANSDCVYPNSLRKYTNRLTSMPNSFSIFQIYPFYGLNPTMVMEYFHYNHLLT